MIQDHVMEDEVKDTILIILLKMSKQNCATFLLAKPKKKEKEKNNKKQILPVKQEAGTLELH